MDEINIGKLIQAKLKEDGRSVSWLAKKLNCDRTNVYKIFNKSNIDVLLLLNICKIINYNFFSYLSEILQEFYEQKNK
jgi:DNA invertase Pin-like site-specific DNA recombinase